MMDVSPPTSTLDAGLRHTQGHERCSAAAPRRAEARRRASAIWAHRERCRALPAPGEAEVAALLAAYHARGGRITTCPAAYAGTVQNGAGRDAARWVR